MKDFVSVVQHNYNISLNLYRHRTPVKLVGGIALSSDLFIAGLKDEVIASSYNIKDRKVFKEVGVSKIDSSFPVVFGFLPAKSLSHFDLWQNTFLSKREVSVLKLLARVYTFNRGLLLDRKYSLQSNFYAYKVRTSLLKDSLYVWNNFGEKKRKFATADFLNHSAFTETKRRKFRRRNRKKGLTSFFLGTRFFLAFRSSKVHVMPFTYNKWISKLGFFVVKFFMIYKFLFKIDVSSLSPYLLKRLYRKLHLLLLKIKTHKFKFLKVYLKRSKVHPVSLLFYSMAYMQFLVLSPFGFFLFKYLSKFTLVYNVVSRDSLVDSNFFVGDLSSIFIYNFLIFKLPFQLILPLLSDVSLQARRLWFVISNLTNKRILNQWLIQGLIFDFCSSNKFTFLLYSFYLSILSKFSVNPLTLFPFLSFDKASFFYFLSNFSRPEVFRTYGFLKLFRLRVLNSFILPFHWSKIGLPTEVDNNFTFFKRDNYLDRRIIATALARQGYKRQFKRFKLRRSTRLLRLSIVRNGLFLNILRGLNNKYFLFQKLPMSVLLKSLLVRFLYNNVNNKSSSTRFLYLLRKIYKFSFRRKKLFSYSKGPKLLLPYRFAKKQRKLRIYRRQRVRLYGFRFVNRLRALNAVGFKTSLRSKMAFRFSNFRASFYKSFLKPKGIAKRLFTKYEKRRCAAILRRRFLRKNRHKLFRFNRSSYKGKSVFFR